MVLYTEMDPRVQKAITKHEQLLETAKANGDRDGQAHAYDNLGQIYVKVGKNQKAEEYFGKCAKTTNEIGDMVGEGLAYYSLGDVKEKEGEYQQAIELYQKSLNIAIIAIDKQLQGMAHYKIGNIYRKLDMYSQAVEHHQQSLDIAKESGNRTGEGRSYCNLGEDMQLMGDFSTAIEYHEKHLSIAKTTSNEREEEIAYRNLGCAYFSLGKYVDAIEYHRKSLSIATKHGDKHGERSSYTNIGVALEQLSKFQDAIEHHKKSLYMAREMGDRSAQGKCYGNLANAYIKLGDVREALEYTTKDLENAEEIGDKRGVGSACGNLAIVYSMLGKSQESIKFALRHLKVSTEIQDRQGEMKAYGNLATVYLSLGNYKEALIHHEKYLEVAKIIQDRHAEARAYSNLGGDYLSLGKYVQAIDLLKKSIQSAHEIGDRKLQGTVSGNLGLCYQHVGQHKDAKIYFEKFLEIAERTGDKVAQTDAHQKLGDINFSLGKSLEAIEHFRKSLNISKITGSKQQEARAYGSLGNCYGSEGQYAEAIKFHQNDLDIAMEMNDKEGESKACENMGNIYLDSGNYEKAQKYIEMSLKIAQEIGDKQGEGVSCLSLGICHHNLSMSYKEKGDDSKALAEAKLSERHFLESIKCNEWLFRQLKQEDRLKISIVDTYINSYQLLTGKYIETEETEKALLISEKKRAQALEDILKSKYNLQRSNSGDLTFISYNDIKDKVLFSNSCLLFYSELLIPHGRLIDCDSSIGTWLIDGDNPAYFQMQKLDDLKSLLEETGSSSGDDKSNILETLVDRAYMNLSVRGTEVSCENRSMDDSKDIKRCVYDEEPDEDFLQMLYEVLVAPFVDKIKEDEIIIIPDGPLFKIPFAALQDPRTKMYLSETKRIRLGASLTTLEILNKSSAESHSMSGALIVGDPDVTGQLMYKGEKRQFSSLPNARLEAESIAEVLGVIPVTGSSATKQSIKRRLQEGVGVIHFAAHGSPDRGEIVLSPNQLETGKIPDEEDYLLTINEVQSIGLRATLVVLSCCHSGRGEIKSEGVVGMSRAFFAAGALAVVASLWAVDDRATKIFMEKFYAHLKRGEKASFSLQQAMKELREKEPYSKPIYWAPFFLIGEDVTITI